jgi:hypothetical protein
MANKVKLKRSYTAGAVPLTTDLDTNECCVNWADGKLFVKNAAGNIVSVTLGGSGGGSGSIVTAASVSAFPATGSASNLYITTEDQRIWRWDATASIYVESGPIGGGFAFASVPSSATATGTAGQIAYDSTFLYLCVATNTWTRTFTGTWSYVAPTQITGLAGWWDASDASTLYDATTGGSLVAADGAIARWQDKSGNSRHATQATSGFRPLRKTSQQNGLAVARFDGSNDWMESSNFLDLTSGAALTLFAVVKRSEASSINAILTKYGKSDASDGTTADGWGFRLKSSADADFFGTTDEGSGASNVAVSGNASASSFSLFSVRASAGAISAASFRRNGSAISSSATSAGAETLTSNAYNVTIGALRYSYNTSSSDYSYLQFLNGDVGEIVLYSTALPDSNRSLIESYLMSKWGIT